MVEEEKEGGMDGVDRERVVHDAICKGVSE